MSIKKIKPHAITVMLGALGVIVAGLMMSYGRKSVPLLKNASNGFDV